MKKWHGLFVLFLLLLAACSSPTPPAATDAPPANPTSLPPTWTQPPPPTETPLPTPTPFQPFGAKALTDNLNLRNNPGTLFGVQQMLTKDTTFQVLAKSPGGEWIYVELADGKQGWVFHQLVSTDQDLQAAPIREPQEVQLVTGIVKNADGQLINGIQFSLQSAVAGSPRSDAQTDESGTFYAFLPADAAGKWYVSFTAIACTSITMDENCNCLNGVCGSISPAVINLTLPQTEPLEFLWQ